LESEFLVICFPRVRENGVGGDLAAEKSGQAEAAIVVEFQKTHAVDGQGKCRDTNASNDNADRGSRDNAVRWEDGR
jgi:hypothetical protein